MNILNDKLLEMVVGGAGVLDDDYTTWGPAQEKKSGGASGAWECGGASGSWETCGASGSWE